MLNILDRIKIKFIVLNILGRIKIKFIVLNILDRIKIKFIVLNILDRIKIKLIGVSLKQMNDHIQQSDPTNFADKTKIIGKNNKWIRPAFAFNKSTKRKREKTNYTHVKKGGLTSKCLFGIY